MVPLTLLSDRARSVQGAHVLDAKTARIERAIDHRTSPTLMLPPPGFIVAPLMVVPPVIFTESG